jgi:hypothetical protein
MSRSRFGRISVLLIVPSFLFVLAASGCSFPGTDSEASTPVPEYRVTFGSDRLFTNEVVQFTLINVESGEIAADRHWVITSPHNVPGDRGVMRSDGLYTAPRMVRRPQIVEVRSRYDDIDYFGEFYVLDPRYPDPEAMSMPGGSHTIFNMLNIETTRPVEEGLPVGESVGFAARDGTGRLLTVDHCEIQRNNRIVDNAGTITPDCVYTAPLVVPEQPKVQISILYFGEGR